MQPTLLHHKKGNLVRMILTRLFTFFRIFSFQQQKIVVLQTAHTPVGLNKVNPRFLYLTRKLPVFILVMVCAMNLHAQVSNYAYTATTGTYTQLSGTGITTTTTVTGGTADDGYLLINLPFSFTYNKIEYNQVTAGTNGYVALGSSTSTNAAATDLFTTTAPTNAIAGWWGNLNLNTANSGAFRYGLTGTNVFTIQFDQLSGASTGATSSTLKVRFQISLYGANSSNPGAVEILFGAATGAVQTARSIGIKSVTSSVVSYKNGLNGSSSNTSTAAAYPATGTLYRFTPPAVAYQSQFISMSTGSATWCSSETRTVTVTVKNIGTATWSTAGAGMNIGLKWDEDADYGSGPSNIPRQSVIAGVPSGTVAPGATVVYTFPNVPSSQVAGTNHLTFDIVKEGDCWFGNNTGSCGPGNDVFASVAQTITLSPTAVAGTAVNTCSNSSAVNITAGSSAANAATTTWTSSGTGTFANANSLTTATYTPSAADISAGSVTLTLTSTPNSPCASNATSNKTLTINQAPTSVAGTAVATCSTSGAVNITAGSGATNQASITWSVTSGTGTLTNANSLTTATYAPSAADISAGSRTIVLTAVGNAGCSNVTSNKTITITSAPTAVAGTAINTCSNSAAVNITAGSSATNAATTTWTSSGTGTFANANSLTAATYTPSAGDISAGSVTLTLTSTPNSPCASNVTSNKTLTINTLPTAVAGTAVSTCSTSGTVNITAGSSATNQLSIAWSVTSGTGTLTNSTSLTLGSYAPSAADITAGSRTIVLTALGKAGCANVTDTKTITITSAPTAAAGTALSTCSNSGPVNITTGSSSGNNSGITWTSSGTGTFANANSLTLATYDPSAADITAGSVTLTLTATPNSPCASNATSNKVLTINTLPTANAGTAVLTCSTSGAVSITAGSSATNQLSITWTSSDGTGTFASATSLTLATYNPSAADKTAGSRTLVLTALGKAGCSNVTSNKIITITAAPTAVAGSAFSTCANSGAINITAGSNATNQASVSWTSSGTGTFANANSLTLATYDPSAADIAAGSVTLTLTAIANSPCANATSNKVLTIRPVATTTGVTICQGTASQALTSSYSCAQTGTQTAGPNLPSAAAMSGSGGAWTNPTNVLTNNGSNATIAINSFGTPTVSQSLNATGFGFSIPANATITAIVVNIERNRSGGSFGEIQDNSVRLLKAGVATGDNDGATSTNWPTSVAVASYNGSTNALWGTTWTVAQINANDFGVALVVDGSSSGGRVANVDYIDVTVSYTVPGTLNWYTASSGGSSIGSGSSFDPVGVLNSGLPNTNTFGTTTFYAECSTVTGCRTPTNYVITAAPDAPVSGGNQTVCSDGSPTQTLTATATGGTITWYDASTNGSIVTPTQVGVGVSTYYAQAFDGSCNSLTRTGVTLTINPVPVANGSNQTVCSDGTLTQTLLATATGGTITWYDAAVGGNVVTTPEQVGVGSVTYYAEAFDGTCTSLTRAAVTLTINPVPAAPISGGDQTVCENGNPTQTLTATATGGTITWYDAATNGNVVTPAQVGVGTSTYYAQASDGTCSSLTRTAVVLTINAAPAAPIASNQTVCEDGNPLQTLTATATGGTITWYDAAVGGNVVGSPVQTGVGTVTYYAESFDGTCTSLTRTAVVLTINAAPAAPVASNQSACEDGNPTQTLTATATGGTITWYDAAVGGNVVANPTQTGVGTATYYAESFNGTCSSLTRTAVTLTIHPAPATASVTITQPDCFTSIGIITVDTPTGEGFEYSIGSDYQTSPVFSGLAPGTYNLSVKNEFGCISLISASATVDPQPFVPGTPVVSGFLNVCPYVGTGDPVTYTASAPGATGYNWILPPNVILQSGGGTGTITVTFDAGFATQANKQIRVTAASVCGTSAQTIYYLAVQFPSTPGVITGTTDICTLIGTANTATYKINKIVAATSYLWTTQSGTTSVTHPNGPGINDTVIVVTYGSGYSSSPITVAAVNPCGTSGSVRSLFVPRTSASTPGLITGSTNVCSNILPNGTATTYTILPIAGATSYTWTAPVNTVITHPNGSGPNDYVITILYPVGFTSGTISVSATNGCGTSGLRSLAITRLNPATPSIIDVIQVQTCPSRRYSYTISSMPANATTVQWNIPAGAVRISETATSVLVGYPSTAVNGVVTVQSFNNCGSSTIRSTTVKLPACPPDEPRMGNNQQFKSGKQPVTLVGTESLDVKVFPNPSVADFNVQVITAGQEKISVRILDMQGRELKNLTVMPNQRISVGADLKAGAYLVETRQGSVVKTVKVIKF